MGTYIYPYKHSNVRFFNQDVKFNSRLSNLLSAFYSPNYNFFINPTKVGVNAGNTILNVNKNNERISDAGYNIGAFLIDTTPFNTYFHPIEKIPCVVMKQDGIYSYGLLKEPMEDITLSLTEDAINDDLKNILKRLLQVNLLNLDVKNDTVVGSLDDMQLTKINKDRAIVQKKNCKSYSVSFEPSKTKVYSNLFNNNIDTIKSIIEEYYTLNGITNNNYLIYAGKGYYKYLKVGFPLDNLLKIFDKKDSKIEPIIFEFTVSEPIFYIVACEFLKYKNGKPNSLFNSQGYIVLDGNPPGYAFFEKGNQNIFSKSFSIQKGQIIRIYFEGAFFKITTFINGEEKTIYNLAEHLTIDDLKKANSESQGENPELWYFFVTNNYDNSLKTQYTSSAAIRTSPELSYSSQLKNNKLTIIQDIKFDVLKAEK